MELTIADDIKSDRKEALDSDQEFGKGKSLDSGHEFGKEKSLDSDQEFGKEKSLDSDQEFGKEKSLDSGHEFVKEKSLDSDQEFGKKKTLDSDREFEKEKSLDSGQEFGKEISLDSGQESGKKKTLDSNKEFGKKKTLDSNKESGKKKTLDSNKEFGKEKISDLSRKFEKEKSSDWDQELENFSDFVQEFKKKKTSNFGQVFEEIKNPDLTRGFIEEKFRDSPPKFEIEKTSQSTRKFGKKQFSNSTQEFGDKKISDLTQVFVEEKISDSTQDNRKEKISDSTKEFEIENSSNSDPTLAAGSPPKESWSRAPDPASANNILDCRVRTQMGRVRMMEKSYAQATQHLDLPLDSLTIAEIDMQIEFIESHWNQFTSTHEKIEELCTPEFLKHPYMLEEVFDRASTAYQRAKEAYVALRNRLENSTGNDSTVPSTNSSQASQPRTPEFSAFFPDWKSFSDRFLTLIGTSKDISNAEKLSRLKNAMRGESAALLAEFPIAQENYDAVWKNLIDYYENRRNLADSQLNRLLVLTPLEKNSPKALSNLVATTNKVLKTSNALELADEHLQCRIMHILYRLLDPRTRQAWDLHLGPRLDLPELSELLDFLSARAHGLHKTERKRGSVRSSGRSSSRPSSINAATDSLDANQQEISSRSRSDLETCSYCRSDDHYIGFCSRFLSMTPADRRAIVGKIGVCKNCLGCHSTNYCHNGKRCRKCGKKHHTLIHSASSSDPGTFGTNSASKRIRSNHLRLSSYDPYEESHTRTHRIRDRLG